MDVSTTPNQVATTALTAIPFSNIIGGPLNAAIEAQAQAAQKTWQFINEVGLQCVGEDGGKEAINVSFSFLKDGKMTKLNIPLLTIVPIPYIAIQSIDASFKANISAASSGYEEKSSSTAGNFEASGGGRVGWGPFKMNVDLKGGYSSKKDSRATQESKYSVEYTIDVGIRAGQDGMPAGLARVLEILNGSLSITDPNGTLAVNSREFVASKDKPALLVVTYMSPKGVYAPSAIIVKSKSSTLTGTLDRNSMTYELSPSDEVYEVTVDGQDKLKETIHVSQVANE